MGPRKYKGRRIYAGLDKDTPSPVSRAGNTPASTNIHAWALYTYGASDCTLPNDKDATRRSERAQRSFRIWKVGVAASVKVCERYLFICRRGSRVQETGQLEREEGGVECGYIVAAMHIAVFTINMSTGGRHDSKVTSRFVSFEGLARDRNRRLCRERASCGYLR